MFVCYVLRIIADEKAAVIAKMRTASPPKTATVAVIAIVRTGTLPTITKHARQPKQTT